MIDSLLSGGLVGALGSLGSNLLGYFKARQEHAQRVELAQLDRELAADQHKYSLQQMAVEAKYRSEQLSIEAERDLSVAEYSALTESYKQDAAYSGDSKLLLAAEFMRKITRPLLTFTLVFMTTAIYFDSSDDVKSLIARAVVALTATVVSWWFADRAVAKRIGNKIL